MRILGIDPGSAVTGFGVVEIERRSVVHIVHGTLRPPRRLNLAERLQFLYAGIESVIRDHEPAAAAAERIFVAAGRRSALVLGEARGAALAAVGASGAAISEYTASQIKLAATGNGRAGKEQVRVMVTRLLDLDRTPATDAADALAAAICHAHSGRLGRFAEIASRQRGSGQSLRVRRAF